MRLILNRSNKIILKSIFHYICYIFGITYLVSLLTKKKLKIILYHRITNHERFTYTNPLRVTPSDFEKQMHYLRRKKFNIISLEDGIDLIINNKTIKLYLKKGLP